MNGEAGVLPNRFQRLCFPSPATQSNGTTTKMMRSVLVVLCVLVVFSDLGKLVSCSPSRGGSGGVDARRSFNFNATLVEEEEVEQPRGHYTPMWAVQIPGGEEVADNVARHHGFVNHGRVSERKEMEI